MTTVSYEYHPAPSARAHPPSGLPSICSDRLLPLRSIICFIIIISSSSSSHVSISISIMLLFKRCRREAVRAQKPAVRIGEALFQVPGPDPQILSHVFGS